MATRSSTAERGEALVRPMEAVPLCDAGVTERLDLSSNAQASAAAQVAGGVQGFELLNAS